MKNSPPELSSLTTNNTNNNYYIGVLSGTSIDAIDAALFNFNEFSQIALIHTHSHPIPPELKNQTLALTQSGHTTLKQVGELDYKWGHLFSESIQFLLKKSQINLENITAIGSHGQTLWHQPKNEYPFTLQIGNPHIIAKITNILTIADFRRGDMALGGQGAPLAPKFHQAYFQNTHHDKIVLNLGGIANISFLPRDSNNSNQTLIGYDTGPANSLLDSWCQLYHNQAYDNQGQWAQSGQIQQDLLNQLLADPYFKRPYPKSTGKDYFNLNWLTDNISACNIPSTCPAADIQATLTELTAITIAQGIKILPLDTNTSHKTEIILCGGGAYNTYLIKRLEYHLGSPFILSNSQSLGIDPDWVEAALFAWLAKANIDNIALDYTAITGAAKPTVLGVRYYP